MTRSGPPSILVRGESVTAKTPGFHQCSGELKLGVVEEALAY